MRLPGEMQMNELELYCNCDGSGELIDAMYRTLVVSGSSYD